MKYYTVTQEVEGDLLIYRRVSPLQMRFLRWVARLCGARIHVREEY